ncbi:hypothetical protein CHS0354_021824 [Potamilus streckersoni]|uniref:Phosphatidic acid phosphatase type 2/haloperoxidase domain-containing protein n=1 Tax=Potamilus streckersoni TaxID=2493646 RepID=A0AAE0VP93_9BIVA|nr:hypothetical protein CHS0354_021824 [Potamilus streckersoni]
MKGCIKKETVPPFLTVQLIGDLIILLTIGLPALVLYMMGSPYKTGFFCDDASLKYPYKRNTISDAMLSGVAFGLTIMTLLIVEVLNIFEKKNKRHRCLTRGPFACLKGFGIFLFGFAIMQLFTEVLKNAVGRLRPNFFDLCRPDFSRIDCSQGYITNYTCTNDEHSASTLRNSRQSFPSGHAAFSIFTSMYLVLYIQKRLHISYSHFLKPAMQAALILLSLLCSVSRITDHMHHSSDVIAGIVIGFMVACAVFHSLGIKHLNDQKRKKVSTVEDIEENSTPAVNGHHTPLPLLQNTFTVTGRPNSFPLKYAETS